jgi:hypothetical protein
MKIFQGFWCKMRSESTYRSGFVLPCIIFFALVILESCAPNSVPSESLADKKPGIADYSVYSCRTATNRHGEKISFEVGAVNNTFNEVELVRNWNAKVQTFRLKKIGSEAWSNGSTHTLRLGLKEDGQKSIRVDDHSLKLTATLESGYCTLYCIGPTILVDGKWCIWSGKTDDDPISNALIEIAATMGASIVKVAFTQLIRTAASKGLSANVGGMLKTI